MSPHDSALTLGIGLCAQCGQELAAGASLCPHHHRVPEEGWAAVNRIMCDLVHRGIAAPRLSAAERGHDLATLAAEAA